MDKEVFAALAGAVVGAVAVGFVTAYLKSSDDGQKAKRAFEIFNDFHERWTKVASGSQTAQKRDYPSLLQSLAEISPLIMQEGHSRTRKTFLEYTMELRELNGYVQNGQWGLIHYPADRLQKLTKQAKSELQDIGIVSLF